MDSAPLNGRHHLEAFMQTLQEKIKFHEVAMRHLDRYVSTRFNVFTYIGLGENQLSDVLRDLLDPDGSHGQGDIFLRKFLTRMGHSEPPTDARMRAYREVPTSRIPSNHRRIDLLVEIGEGAIAIENKPRAREQVDQIRDYVDHLHRKYPSDWCLIYLTPNGRNPCSIDVAEAETLRDEGHLIEKSYAKDIVPWVEWCVTACESDRYRWFLRDFQAHLMDSYPAATQEE